ncbi:MAG: hypothetical protein M1598_01610 [Actinobacteria bacterium]|nr:hypothetical protein [Actinomycetota bacterium]
MGRRIFNWLDERLNLSPLVDSTVAALGAPGVVLLYLVLLSFLDRRPEKPATKRPLVTTVGVLGLVAVLALTSLAELEDFQRQRALAAKPPGLVVYEANKCDSCHVLNGKGGDTGPDLTHKGSMGRSADWQAKHLKDPASVVSGSFIGLPPRKPRNYSGDERRDFFCLA